MLLLRTGSKFEQRGVAKLPDLGSGSAAGHTYPADVRLLLTNKVRQVVAASYAFLAITDDGGVAWGWGSGGGDISQGCTAGRPFPSQVGDLLTESTVQATAAGPLGFVVLVSDAVVTIGERLSLHKGTAPTLGPYPQDVSDYLGANVQHIVEYNKGTAHTCFAAAGSTASGGVAVFGEYGGANPFAGSAPATITFPSEVRYPGDIRARVASSVVKVVCNLFAMAAITSEGAVVAWGEYSGDLGSSAHLLSSNVVDVFATGLGFAALRSDGLLVSWGDVSRSSGSGHTFPSFPTDVSAAHASGVKRVFTNAKAFVALKH